MNFTEAMSIADQGFEAWAAKDHNAKWVRRIQGTPIRTDLLVNIALVLVEDSKRRADLDRDVATIKCSWCGGNLCADGQSPGE